MLADKKANAPLTKDTPLAAKLEAPMTIAADHLEAVAGGTLSTLAAAKPRPVNGLVEDPM